MKSVVVSEDSNTPITRSADGIFTSECGSLISLSSYNSVRIHRSASFVDTIHAGEYEEQPFPNASDGQHPVPLSQAQDIGSAPFIKSVSPNLKPSETSTPANFLVPWTTPRVKDDEVYMLFSTPPVSSFENQLDQSSTQKNLHKRRPFNKWVQTLRRRRGERRRLRESGRSGQTPVSNLCEGPVDRSVSLQQSSSVSSFAYVSAVRDASISCASTSIVASSRKQRARSSKRLSKTDRSSHTTYSIQCSEDDRLQYQADPAILERSRQRWQILEELIETEEGYIGDIKFLTKVSRLGNHSVARYRDADSGRPTCQFLPLRPRSVLACACLCTAA